MVLHIKYTMLTATLNTMLKYYSTEKKCVDKELLYFPTFYKLI